jgi:hypothetical protein
MANIIEECCAEGYRLRVLDRVIRKCLVHYIKVSHYLALAASAGAGAGAGALRPADETGLLGFAGPLVRNSYFPNVARATTGDVMKAEGEPGTTASGK